MVVLSDYYEEEFPEHIRNSCSDEDPQNADVRGHDCWRCNAIFFTRATEAFAEVAALKARASMKFKTIEEWRADPWVQLAKLKILAELCPASWTTEMTPDEVYTLNCWALDVTNRIKKLNLPPTVDE